MASNDKSGPDDEAVEGSWSPRRSKASSSKARQDDAAKPDPDELVDDIEKTREELAETLDAIADKVSPKRVADRTKKSAKDGAHQAAESVKQSAGEAAETAKETAAHAAESVKQSAGEAAETAKETAAHAAESVKQGVAAVKEKVSGDDAAVRSPLAPATSVELDAATPLPGAEVPLEPAPTPGGLADASYVAVEPTGAEAPVYTSTLPPQSPSRAPLVAGVGAAAVLLLLLRRRRRRR